MKKRKERLENFFNKLPFDKNLVEVFNAVDGKQILPKKAVIDLFDTNVFKYRCGETGCSLSHLFLWKKIIEKGYRKTLVLEDDSFFFDDAIDKWNSEYYSDLPNEEDFHACNLGGLGGKISKYQIGNINKYFSLNRICIGSFGSYAYIISRSGAELLCRKIEGIGEGFKMQRPIDYIINTYLEPDKLITCNNLLAFSLLDYQTDIQRDFSTIFKNERILKIMFLDFWPDFNPHDNLFTDMISHFGNSIIVTDDINNCDLLIYSSYSGGDHHRKYCYFNYVRKIYYSGEKEIIDPGACVSISFNRWYFYINWFSKNKDEKIPLDLFYQKDREILKKKNKFCCFIPSNPKSKFNDEVSHLLNRKVDLGGFELDSIGRMIEYDIKDKMEFLKSYKFNLLTDSGNYLSNILTTYASGCIPIFWNSSSRDLNKGSYIDSRDFGSDEEFANFIEKVDKDDTLWYQIYNKSTFTGLKLKEDYFNFFEGITKKIIGDL